MRSIGSMSAWGPVTHPPVTSACPLRYFVALCIARSTPSAIGCWLIGLANVLSSTETTPRARHAAATTPDVDAPQRRIDRRLEPAGLRPRADQPVRVAPARRAYAHRTVMPSRGSTSLIRWKRPAVERRAATPPRLPPSGVRTGSSRWRPSPTRTAAPPPPRRAPRASARPHARSGWRSANRGTSSDLPFLVPANLVGRIEHERRRLDNRHRDRVDLPGLLLAAVDDLGRRVLWCSSCRLALVAESEPFPARGHDRIDELTVGVLVAAIDQLVEALVAVRPRVESPPPIERADRVVGGSDRRRSP